jgi:hypothetical protein
VTLRRSLLLAALAVSAVSTRADDQAPPPIESYAHVTGDDGKTVKVPLFQDQAADVVAARVGDDVITVRDLGRALMAAHGNVTDATKAGKKDPTAILDRMIEVRLLVQEARSMGIADLPEIQEAFARYREAALIEALKLDVLKDVRPDPEDVERRYRDAVREWKLQSTFFPKLEDAKPVSDAIRKGGSFDALVKQAVADGKAQGGGPAEFVARAKVLPEVVNVLERMKKGEVSKPIRLAEGYTIVRLVDLRYPEDAKAREEARSQALVAAQKKAVKKYYDALVKQHVRTDEKLLKKLDYEAKKPGIAALRKDPRVLARLDNGQTVTVADLTAGMESELQHGIEQAIQTHRANKMRFKSFDAVVSRKLVPWVARQRGMDKTPAYQRSVDEYQTSTLFSHFVDKAIVADVKFPDADVKKYYEAHRSDFTLPGFYKLDGMAFTNAKSAQAALGKLKSGADLKFLRATSDHQVPDGQAELKLGGLPVAASTIPAELRDSLASAKKGDYRLYTTPRGQSYVIQVVDLTPPEVEPYEQAASGIQRKLLAERVTQSTRDWAAKLRQTHPVKVYVTRVGA